jgi:hypothetical protein
MITGSVASSLQGEPRATHDLDVVVAVQAKDVAALVEGFSHPRRIASLTGFLAAARRNCITLSEILRRPARTERTAC